MLRIYVTPPPTITSEDGDISSPPSDGTTPGMPPPRAAAPPGQFFQELLDPRLFGQFAPPPPAPPGKFFQQLLDPRRFGQLAPPQPAPPGQFLASIGVKLPPAVPPAPATPAPAVPASAPAPAAPDAPASGEGEGDGLARNAAAGLSEGVYGTLGLPVDAATWLVNRGIDGVNAVTGADIANLQDLPLGSRSIATNLEHYAGIPDPAKVRAVTLAEKAARAAGEGAAYAIAPQALLRAGAVAAGTRLLPALETLFGNANSVRRLAGDALAGGVGGGAGALAGEAAPEPLKPLAEFGGNLAGGGLVAAAEDLPRLIAQGGRAIRDFAAPLIGGAMDQPARPVMVTAGGVPPVRPLNSYENRMATPERPSAARAVPETPAGWSNAEIFAPPDPAAGKFRTDHRSATSQPIDGEAPRYPVLPNSLAAIDPPERLTFFRGDKAGTTAIESHAMREYGYAGSQRIIEEGDLSELLMRHADNSADPPSPFVSITPNRRVAEHFAGPDGVVNEFLLTPGRVIPNTFNNYMVPAGPNGELIPESEWLVPNYIRPNEFVRKP